jgi:CRP-like cAMP-binding protein
MPQIRFAARAPWAPGSVPEAPLSALDARRNRLLAALPGPELAHLLPELEPVRLAAGEVLAEAGQPVSHVHLPAGAVLSLVVAMADGSSAEGATVGREGAIGSVAGGTDRAAFARTEVQIPGPAFRIPLDRFEAVRSASPTLQDMLDRYADALLAQVLQSVACNVLHPIEGRLARWLLMTLDRVTDEAGAAAEVPMPQDAIAVMLGAHRVTVGEALGVLEDAALLRRGRGRVRVLDRPGLERRACECYAAVRSHYDRLLPGALVAGSEAR